MTFITGARQVGKTHLTQQIEGASYFSWDTPEVKKEFLKNPYFFRNQSKIVIFDEIHKRRDWKKLLKGYYDSKDRQEKLIITGSAVWISINEAVTVFKDVIFHINYGR